MKQWHERRPSEMTPSTNVRTKQQQLRQYFKHTLYMKEGFGRSKSIVSDSRTCRNKFALFLFSQFTSLSSRS